MFAVISRVCISQSNLMFGKAATSSRKKYYLFSTHHGFCFYWCPVTNLTNVRLGVNVKLSPKDRSSTDRATSA